MGVAVIVEGRDHGATTERLLKLPLLLFPERSTG